MHMDLLAVILAMLAHRAFYLFSWASTTHLLYSYIFYSLSLSAFLVVRLFLLLDLLSKIGINTQKSRPKFHIPWLCAGDFNELIRSDEKFGWGGGGNRRSHNQMQLFWDAIDECGFIDLSYLGSKFTWKKYFASGQLIWERLDRTFCTNDWLQ